MEPFIAQICLFGGNFAPRGWAFCNGQLLPISQNTALFSLIGTIYGGDGRQTFALPDLRGRAPIHMGNGRGLSNYNQGTTGGRETNILNVSQLPSHNHPLTSTGATLSGTPSATVSGAPGVSMNVANNNDGSDAPNGKFLGQNDGGGIYAGSPTAGEQLAGTAISADAGTLAVSVDTSGMSVNMTGATVGNTGGNQSINNMPPYIAMNYIIALYGIFPSRS